MAWIDVSSQWCQELVAMEMEDNYLDRGYYHGDDGEAIYADYPEDYPLDEDYGNYDPYNAYYNEEDVYYTKISTSELFEQCIIPTVSQACQTILPLLGMCFVSRITSYFVAEVLRGSNTGQFILHTTSAISGLVALHWFFHENLIYLIMLGILAYLLLFVTWCKCRALSGVTVAFVTVVYLITCELAVVRETEWHQIRGAQMILSMKIISLGFDVSSGAIVELPGVFEYTGYVFQVGSVMFGPWISYQQYIHLLSSHKVEKKLLFYWICKLVRSFILCNVCIIISTCIIHWLVIEYSFIWLLACRDAQSFRFSHYFISYLSELTLTMSGLGTTKNNGDVRWDVTVTRPYHIELPRSLVEIVTNWNLPMHHWLKTYVFKTARPLGNFTAILLTYAASSILHGLNFQLSAVLLSLGFYTYVEYVLRQHLSKSFDACILAKRCKPDCEHSYKSTHPYVVLVNLSFGLLSVFHLTYLGLMFDNSSSEEQGYSMDHTLSKWSELGYASHWVALAMYIFYILI